MTRTPPKFTDAPGHVIRPTKHGWVVRWEARYDLIKRGFTPKGCRLWVGVEPTEVDREVIAASCRRLQAEMLVWGHGGVPEAGAFDCTLRSLIRAYQMDAASPYRKLRFVTRVQYDNKFRRIADEYGDIPLDIVKARTILEWHAKWADKGRVPMAHGMVTMLRLLFSFGATFLEDAECERLSTALGRMKFEMGKPRDGVLTAEQVIAIRALAHKKNWPSIALAQAVQFECMLRQKDVIGEYVPLNEPGASDIVNGNEKWLRGIRWNEIDGNLILKHTTSKRGKVAVFDLKFAPMVMEELQLLGEFPRDGRPLIIDGATGLPYRNVMFRRRWRIIADELGIPKNIRNMDSRAGAITEGADSGAELDDLRHAATHSDISTTARYSRQGTERTAKVMKMRAEGRNKPGTKVG